MMFRSIRAAAAAAVIAGLATACSGPAALPAAPTAAAGCDVSLSPSSQSAQAATASYHTTVTGQCGWTAAPDVPWILVTHSAGAGAGSVTYVVQEHSGSTARTGHVQIGDETLTVTQSPACTFEVDPSTRRFAASGGPAEVRVATAAGCEWTASVAEPWIAIAVTGGRGPGSVALTVSANSGGERSALLMVGGRSVVVVQEAHAAPPQQTPSPDPAGCTYSVRPTAFSMSWQGGVGTVTIETRAGCAWSVSGGAPWIEFRTASGTGSGSVVFGATGNASGSDRRASFSVGGTSVSIEQGRYPYAR